MWAFEVIPKITSSTINLSAVSGSRSIKIVVGKSCLIVHFSS
jgi:hypothetical protein